MGSWLEWEPAIARGEGQAERSGCLAFINRFETWRGLGGVTELLGCSFVTRKFRIMNSKWMASLAETCFLLPHARFLFLCQPVTESEGTVRYYLWMYDTIRGSDWQVNRSLHVLKTKAHILLHDHKKKKHGKRLVCFHISTLSHYEGLPFSLCLFLRFYFCLHIILQRDRVKEFVLERADLLYLTLAQSSF